MSVGQVLEADEAAPRQRRADDGALASEQCTDLGLVIDPSGCRPAAHGELVHRVRDGQVLVARKVVFAIIIPVDALTIVLATGGLGGILRAIAARTACGVALARVVIQVVLAGSLAAAPLRQDRDRPDLGA